MYAQCSSFYLISGFILTLLFITACEENDDFDPRNAEIEREEVAELTLPPEVPPPIDRDEAIKQIINLEIVEKDMRLADGVEYTM